MKMIRKIVCGFLILPVMITIAIAGGSSGGSRSTDVNFSEYEYSFNSQLVGDLILKYATKSKRVNSPFGTRYDPLSGKRSTHTGTDYACYYGDPIFASASGEITVNGVDMYGALVIQIKHSKSVSTKYLHMQKSFVTVGQKVKQGEKIAECGSTGYSTGPHLHLCLLIDGKYENVDRYIKNAEIVKEGSK